MNGRPGRVNGRPGPKNVSGRPGPEDQKVHSAACWVSGSKDTVTCPAT